MKTELELLQQLKTFLSENLNNYIDNPLEVPEISASNIEIDYPDTDNMRCPTMFYIVPDVATFENLTMSSDLTNFDITIFILTKKDKQENLIAKIFSYFTAFYQCLKSDISLGSYVDNTNLSTMEFYPAVEGNKSIVGMEVKIQMQFTKDY